MKIFLASLALIIAVTFVFEVHQLTKAVREPSVQLNISVAEACQSNIDVNKKIWERDCVQWIASYFPVPPTER